MRLSGLLAGCRIIHASGNLERQVLGIAYDSRRVEKDFVFVAVRGFRADGNRFAAQAVANGAAAIVSAAAPPAEWNTP